MMNRRLLAITIAALATIQGVAPANAQPTAEHKRLEYVPTATVKASRSK